ncbi:MAG: hypothetical protein PWQ79_1933 [Thermococcaceae archaeon]|nr:hypothetical protein [Thermococcaceae archaeon]MDK2915018.1 hypothetical protein [Thermococcaceae archaeon]
MTNTWSIMSINVIQWTHLIHNETNNPIKFCMG